MFTKPETQFLAILAFAVMTSACNVAPDPRIEDSREVAKALGQQLKQTLQQSIQKEGPVAALDVCRVEAPAIAADLSAQNKLQVSRTALRVRNTDNTPAAWQAEVLRDFEQRLEQGEGAETLEYSTHAETAEGKQYRYMKAIITESKCLICHGSTLAAPLQESISELYPNDKAVGFEEGALRGAFVVEWPIDEGS